MYAQFKVIKLSIKLYIKFNNKRMSRLYINILK